MPLSQQSAGGRPLCGSDETRSATRVAGQGALHRHARDRRVPEVRGTGLRLARNVIVCRQAFLGYDPHAAEARPKGQREARPRRSSSRGRTRPKPPWRTIASVASSGVTATARAVASTSAARRRLSSTLLAERARGPAMSVGAVEKLASAMYRAPAVRSRPGCARSVADGLGFCRCDVGRTSSRRYSCRLE